MKYLKYLFFGLLVFICFEAKSQNEFDFSPDSLYNLGNVAFNQEQYDKAIFYYEKAKLLDPWAEDIKVNLQLANENLSTDIIELEPFFIASWWNKFTNFMLPWSWKIISILLLICSIVVTYFHFFKKKIKSKVYYRGIIGIVFTFFIISVFAGITRADRIFN